MSRASSRAGGTGTAAVDASAALLQAFDHQYAGGEIHAINGQRQSFGQTASGIGQGHAERPHLAINPLGLAQKVFTLASRQIFPRPVLRVQLHIGL